MAQFLAEMLPLHVSVSGGDFTLSCLSFGRRCYLVLGQFRAEMLPRHVSVSGGDVTPSYLSFGRRCYPVMAQFRAEMLPRGASGIGSLVTAECSGHRRAPDTAPSAANLPRRLRKRPPQKCLSGRLERDACGVISSTAKAVAGPNLPQTQARSGRLSPPSPWEQRAAPQNEPGAQQKVFHSRRSHCIL